MVKVLISDKLGEDAVRILEARRIETVFAPDLGKDPQALKEAVADIDGLAIRSATTATAELIAAAPKLKVIGRAGIGVDNIDIPAATAAGIAVMNTPFGNAVTTAEHALAMMFAISRHIPQADASIKEGRWEKSAFMGRELFGKTLGLIGCGNIGGIVASRAQALRMKVIVYDPFLSEERAAELGVRLVELGELAARADFVSLHTPLNAKTRGIVGEGFLRSMRKGSYLVNCARGGLVDERALAEALREGPLAGAALDVFEEEPLGESPLRALPNIVMTPHLGASTREAQENVAVQIAEQIADYLLDGAVQNALNMPSVTAEEAPVLRPFMALGETLGSLAGQLSAGALTGITIKLAGEVARLNAAPIVSGVVAAAMKPQLDTVNTVNAVALARERGIALTEEKTETSRNFGSTLTVRVQSKDASWEVTGALFGGEPRIVRLGEVRLEASITEHMLFVINDDKPGFIGSLGEVLRGADINVATFNLGRREQGAEAMALIALDNAMTDETLRAIEDLPQVRRAVLMRFVS
jgi:D-3-phosphoglycerate dehydrogenase